jgi:hypothetical protein
MKETVMAIGIRTSLDRQFVTIEPCLAHGKPAKVFVLQCHECGYEPDDCLRPPRLCPKCHSRSWDRFARPGSILANAERYSA